MNLSSNQMASALIYSIGTLYGTEYVSTNLHLESPPFQISSTFPYLYSDTNESIYFYPLPLLPIRSDNNGDFYPIKDMKKVQFIEESIFWKLINGNMTINEIFSHYTTKYQRKGNCLALKSHSFTKIIIDTEYRTHNQINRLQMTSSEFFHLKSINYARAGIFFLIHIQEDKWIQLFKAGLRFLVDQGLGGDISIGQGWCEMTCTDYPRKIASLKESNKFVLLSIYSPTKEEISMLDMTHSYYTLVAKQSRSRKGFLRKKVYLFTEGSIIALKEPRTPPLGQLREVQKATTHPIIIWGQALAVPLKERATCQ